MTVLLYWSPWPELMPIHMPLLWRVLLRWARPCYQQDAVWLQLFVIARRAWLIQPPPMVIPKSSVW